MGVRFPQGAPFLLRKNGKPIPYVLIFYWFACRCLPGMLSHSMVESLGNVLGDT